MRARLCLPYVNCIADAVVVVFPTSFLFQFQFYDLSRLE